MRAVRVDQYGELHCWNCLSTSFERKRSVHSKVMSAVGGRASRNNLRCLVCGQYNDVGNAKKITVPNTTALIPIHPTPVGDPLDRLRRGSDHRAFGRGHR
jgi:hypothetical protein